MTGSDPPSAAPSPVPRMVLVLLGSAAMIVVAAGIRSANSVLAPVLLALVLTIAVAPVRGVALRRGAPAWAATVLVMVTAYGIVLFLTLSIAASVVQLAATLPQYADSADQLAASAHDALTKLGLADQPTGTALSQLDLGKLRDFLGGLLSGLLEVLSSFFFLAALLFFMTSDVATVHRRTDLLRRVRPAMMDSLDGFAHGTQRYLIVSAVFGAIVAVLDTGALWLIGVPLALLWGLLAFVTNFIPNIGFVIGLVPPALLGLLDGGWQTMVAVVVVYCVLNVVIQTFIQPRYVGDSVGLSTTVTFLSLAVWTYLLGSLGALLAVPMTLLVRALLIDPDPSLSWANLLIGSAPPPSDDVGERKGGPASSSGAGDGRGGARVQREAGGTPPRQPVDVGEDPARKGNDVSIGPVQLITLGFSHPDFHGEIRAELERLRQSDTVRVIDALAVYKDAAGGIEVEHLSNLSTEEAVELGTVIGALIGLGIEGEKGLEEGAVAGAEAAAEGIHAFSDEEAWDVLEEIPNDSAAALLLLEHQWAVPLRDAVMRAGGFRISDGFISPLDLVQIGMLSAEEAADLTAVETGGAQRVPVQRGRSAEQADQTREEV